MNPSSVSDEAEQHDHAAGEKCGVIKVHPRPRVRHLALLNRERIENHAAGASFQLVETAIVGC